MERAQENLTQRHRCCARPSSLDEDSYDSVTQLVTLCQTSLCFSNALEIKKGKSAEKYNQGTTSRRKTQHQQLSYLQPELFPGCAKPNQKHPPPLSFKPHLPQSSFPTWNGSKPKGLPLKEAALVTLETSSPKSLLSVHRSLPTNRPTCEKTQVQQMKRRRKIVRLPEAKTSKGLAGHPAVRRNENGSFGVDLFMVAFEG